MSEQLYPDWNPEMTFHEFSAANRRRCEAPNGFNHKLSDWSTSDWMTAIMGELGEAANVVKKLNRIRDGIPGNKETKEKLEEQLRHELCDVLIYLDLLCQSLGFKLADSGALQLVYNVKSEQIGYMERI